MIKEQKKSCKRFCQFLYIFLGAFSLISCNENPLRVDVSNIDLDLKVNRLDQELFLYDPMDPQFCVGELISSQGEFFETYNQQIINLGTPYAEEYPTYLKMFIDAPIVKGAKSKVDSVYVNFDNQKKTMEEGFKHYLYYFPNKEIPKVYTYISGFNESITMKENILGISIDKYIGSDCSFYEELGVPRYKKINMTPEQLPYDALMGWVMNQFPKQTNSMSLVDEMIYQGKMLYLMDAIFPDGPDSLKIGYTEKQLDFCKISESGMWTYMVDKQLLFRTDRLLHKKFIAPAPFTNPFTNESPGRSGIWIGWQIVRSFMKNNPEVSVQELVTEIGPRDILNRAKYFPE